MLACDDINLDDDGTQDKPSELGKPDDQTLS